MKIICLFGQRECSYPGQYAPELLDAIDEIGNSDNSDYLDESEKKYADYKEFTIIKRITVSIPDEEFDAAFFPKEIEIKGKVDDIS